MSTAPDFAAPDKLLVHISQQLLETWAEQDPTAPLQSTLNSILNQLAREVIGDVSISAMVALYDQRSFQVAAAIGPLGPFMRKNSPRQEGTSAHVVREQQPLFIDDVTHWPSDVPTPKQSVLNQNGVKAFVNLPLIIGESHQPTVVGVLVIYLTTTYHFTEEQQQAIQLFGIQAAITIQNALVFQRELLQKDAVRLVSESATTGDPKKVWSTIAEQVIKVTRVTYAALFAVDNDSARLRLVEIYPKVDWRPDTLEIPLAQQSINGHVAQTQQSYYAPDVREDPFYMDNDQNTASAFCVPLQVNDKTLGTLYVASPVVDGIDIADQRFIEQLVPHASMALHHARLQNIRQDIIQFQQAISDILPLDEQFTQIRRQLQDRVNTSGLFIALLRGESIWFPKAYWRGELLSTEDVQVAGNPYYPRKINERRGLVEWCLQKRATLFVQDFEQWPGRDAIDETERNSIRCCLVVPMFSKEEMVGAIGLQGYDTAGDFDEYDKEFLEGIANHIAVIIENSAWYSEEERQRLLLEKVQSIHERIADVLSLQEQARQIREELQVHFDTDGFFIGTFDEETKVIETLEVYRDGEPVAEPDQPANTAYPYRLLGERHGLIDYVLTRQESLRVDNFDTWADRDHISPEYRDGVKSCLVVPMMHEQKALGVIGLRSYSTANAFDEHDQELLEAVANVIAIVLSNAHTYQQRLEEMRAVSQFQRKVSNIPLDIGNLTPIYTEVHEAMQGVGMDVSTMYIALYSADTEMIEFPLVYEGGTPLSRDAANVNEAYLGRRLGQRRDLTEWIIRHRKTLLLGSKQEFDTWVVQQDDIDTGLLRSKCWLGAPMIFNDQIIGMIGLKNFDRSHCFDEFHKDLLNIIASQSAIAIQNARGNQRQQSQAADREALMAVSSEIVGSLDLERVLDLILEKALDLTEASAGVLALCDPSLQNLHIAAHRGVPEEQQVAELNLSQGIVGWVLTHLPTQDKLCLNVADVAQPPWKERYLPLFPEVRSELVVLLRVDGKVRGAIDIESPIAGNFGERDERLLVDLAKMAAIALRNAETYTHAENRRQSLEALHHIDLNIIRQSDDPYAVMRVILESALTLTRADTADLHIYEDGDRQSIYDAHMNEADTIEFNRRNLTAQIPPGIVGIVARNRKSYITGEAQKDPAFKGVQETNSEVAVPLITSTGEHFTGVLNVESSQHHFFTEEDVTLLELLAGQAVIALQNARNFAQAQEESQRFALLHGAGQQLGELSDIQQCENAYDVIMETAASHVAHSQVTLRLYDEQTNQLIVKRVRQERDTSPQEYIAIDKGWNGQAASERRTLVIQDVHHPPPEVVVSNLADKHLHSYMIVPIFFEERYYGNLTVGRDEVDAFRESDILLMEGLARQLAITIHRMESAEAQRQAEQQARVAEVMTSIGQQSFELTHQLGNHLGLVRSRTNNIRRALGSTMDDNPVVERNLDKIVQDVQKVLDLSKNLKQELMEFDPNQDPGEERAYIPAHVLLEDAAQSITPPTNINIQYEVAEPRAEVYISHNQIATSLSNLVQNAIEAMRAGGTLILRLREDGRYILLDVEDSGEGIPEELQTRVFELQFSTKGSSGFGLWSARRNAIANDGELTMVSTPGKGTTFTLKLPKAAKE